MNIEELKNPSFKAGLFDLDGVIVDTESQYTIFWGGIGREYHPEIPDFAHRIKGQTLVQISEWFKPEEMESIVARLDRFESEMDYSYIPGAFEYLKFLKSRGIRLAIVTSSNQVKMDSLWKQRPELRELFDRVLTSEDFKASKPDPYCYVLGTQIFGLTAEECVVFEDSFSGVKAGKASGCRVVGLATTNPAEALQPFCNIVMNDFKDLI